MCALVRDLDPRDHLEMMLASQMAAVRVAVLRAAGELARANTFPQQDIAERTFNKLARTFVTQVEALKRYRTGGEPKVHVSVSEGGRAIVGNVTQAPMRDCAGRGGSATASAHSSDARHEIVDERSSTS
jgi:hypothetical protein